MIKFLCGIKSGAKFCAIVEVNTVAVDGTILKYYAVVDGKTAVYNHINFENVKARYHQLICKVYDATPIYSASVTLCNDQILITEI